MTNQGDVNGRGNRLGTSLEEPRPRISDARNSLRNSKPLTMHASKENAELVQIDSHSKSSHRQSSVFDSKVAHAHVSGTNSNAER